MKEYDDFKLAAQRYKEVTPGGKLYNSCSFMDISVRATQLERAKEAYITALGTLEYNKLHSNKKE